MKMRIGCSSGSRMVPVLPDMLPNEPGPGCWCDARRQRRLHAHSRPGPGSAVDVKGGGNALRPPAHAADAEAGETAFRNEAHAVVFDFKKHRLGSPGEANRQTGRAGVAHRVGNG